MTDSERIAGQHTPTNLINRETLLVRLNRGVESRARFVDSHISKGIAFQIRSLRDRAEWTQAEFSRRSGIAQNNISSRLENPYYSNYSLRTLKTVAQAYDVGLVVWFVPFSRLVDWVTGTPYIDNGLSSEFYKVANFGEELANGQL